MGKINISGMLLLAEISSEEYCKIARSKRILIRQLEEYHAFSFTQIIFAIKDALTKNNEDSENKIFKYFGGGDVKNPEKYPNTSTGRISFAANNWKHGSFEIYQNFSFPDSPQGVEYDKVVDLKREREFFKTDPKKRYSFKQEMQTCLEEVKIFCKDEFGIVPEKRPTKFSSPKARITRIKDSDRVRMQGGF